MNRLTDVIFKSDVVEDGESEEDGGEEAIEP